MDALATDFINRQNTDYGGDGDDDIVLTTHVLFSDM
jgi:hypothetical protein